MKTYNEKSFEGRVYETKDSFVIESVISEETENTLRHVRLEDVSDFINSKLREFDKKNVKVEVTIKIEEK
jgi:hypothetical protein